MELNATFFSNVSSNNETNRTESDTEANPHPFLIYLNLFGLPLGVLLVVVPALTVIIIILKNRRLREKSNNIFYVNLLIADVVTALLQWIITTTIIVCYLLDVPNVNCKVAVVPLSASIFATRLMFMPVVTDRLIHIAFPFSYKGIFTTKRIATIIGNLWLLSLFAGFFSLVNQDYTPSPESGTCSENNPGISLLFLVIAGTLVTSTAIITGTCVYLHYKIIHSNRFFKSVRRRNATEEQKAVKVGRLMEILQEQVKPTFSVFIAGGIDAVFNVFGIIFVSVGAKFGSEFLIRFHILILAVRFCQYCTHAVVYALRDKHIRKEIFNTFRKIMG